MGVLYKKSRGAEGSIKDDIEMLYYKPYEFDSSSDQRLKYDTIVANRMGTRIKEYCDYFSRSLTMDAMASHYFLKYRKKYKRYITKIRNCYIKDLPKKLKKIYEYSLVSGVYHARLDNTNFLVLFIDTSDDTSSCSLYFIGKEYHIYMKEFNKYVDKLRKNFKNNSVSDIIIEMGSFGARMNRDVVFKPFDKMIFANKEKIIKYIDNWFENIPTYYDTYNIIPKLSILLYGKPGTGKSTFYQALSKHLDIPTVVSLLPTYFSGKQNAREDAVYALDDIDTFVNSREDDAKNNDTNSDRMNDILAFLDHPPVCMITAKNGNTYPVSIVVATTNYYDKLDPAIKRYGRFDLKIEMNDFDYTLAEKFCKLYNIHLDSICDVSNKETFHITPAELQAKCIENVDKQMKEV